MARGAAPRSCAGAAERVMLRQISIHQSSKRLDSAHLRTNERLSAKLSLHISRRASAAASAWACQLPHAVRLRLVQRALGRQVASTLWPSYLRSARKFPRNLPIFIYGPVHTSSDPLGYHTLKSCAVQSHTGRNLKANPCQSQLPTRAR